MWLIVGLGNPGEKYTATRHNIGFVVVDELMRKHSFSEPTDKFKGKLSTGTIEGEKVAVLKPQTYMNLSGESVRAAMDFYKLEPSQIIVIHDEIDLPFGEIRAKKGGGSAGHNGLKSITKHLGTPDYIRIRFGVSHPRELGLKIDVSDYVLGKFTASEQAELEPLVEKTLTLTSEQIKG